MILHCLLIFIGWHLHSSIIDANGCIFTNLVISEPSEVTTNLISNDISCYGNCDGFICNINWSKFMEQ